jgi:hypothetical protein
VILAIIRQTFGWRKEFDRISLSQLERLTGLTRESVSIGLNAALDHGHINRKPHGNSFVYSLTLVGKSDQSENPTSQQFRPKTVGISDQKVVNNSDPQKKGIKEKKESSAAPANGKDLNLTAEAVVSYREICHITPNHAQREQIVTAVKDITAWKSVLNRFMGEGRAPQRVDWALERYAAATSRSKSRALTAADLERMGV